MPINKNNVLRWTGAPTMDIGTFTMTSPTDTFFANVDSLTMDPFAGSSCSLGFDKNTFEMLEFLNFVGLTPVEFSRPPYFDGSVVTFYRPTDISMTGFYVNCQVRDYAGNLSPSFILNIFLSTVSVGWVAYPASASCSLDLFGVNNGKLEWSQLKLINIATMSDISPLTLKDNISSDPDYIPPVTDLITCPVPSGGTYAPLTIANFSNNPANIPEAYITITQITIACSACGSGGSPLVQNFSCNIPPGSTQQFLIMAIPWDTGLTILYDVTGDMDFVSNPVLWRSQANGAVDDFPSGSPHQVDNSGIYGNFSITLTYPNGLTIFCK